MTLRSLRGTAETTCVTVGVISGVGEADIRLHHRVVLRHDFLSSRLLAIEVSAELMKSRPLRMEKAIAAVLSRRM